MPFDANRSAAFIAEAHRKRSRYENLPAAFGPTTVDEAYSAQEALATLWRAERGEIAGLKIATTTRVMQELMGIDHPCGGMIFAKTVHTSPVVIDKASYMNVVVECELAVRLARDLPDRGRPYERDDVRAAIGSVMPAFELIEDRQAVYKESRALSLIADNAWNAGIVLGAERPVPAGDLNGLDGTLAIKGQPSRHGKTDDPLGALAWVANLAVGRGRAMKAGMVVITGSVIATLPIAPGEHFAFTLSGLGSVEMTAR